MMKLNYLHYYSKKIKNTKKQVLKSIKGVDEMKEADIFSNFVKNTKFYWL